MTNEAIEKQAKQGVGASPSDAATGLSQAEPEVSALRASIPSAVAQIILDRLDWWQRDFILKMKPHNRDQRISKADWEEVEPCVDYEPDGWPDVYWFGGMTAASGAGYKGVQRTFRFNEVGLEVRAVLASAIEARSDETHSGSAEGEGAGPQDDAQ